MLGGVGASWLFLGGVGRCWVVLVGAGWCSPVVRLHVVVDESGGLRKSADMQTEQVHGGRRVSCRTLQSTS